MNATLQCMLNSPLTVYREHLQLPSRAVPGYRVPVEGSTKLKMRDEAEIKLVRNVEMPMMNAFGALIQDYIEAEYVLSARDLRQQVVKW